MSFKGYYRRVGIRKIFIRNYLFSKCIQIGDINIDLLIVHPVFYGHLELNVALRCVGDVNRDFTPLSGFASRNFTGPFYRYILWLNISRCFIIGAFQLYGDGIGRFDRFEITIFFSIGSSAMKTT